MASVKVKFRPSTIAGKEGSIYPCNPSDEDRLPDIYGRMERS